MTRFVAIHSVGLILIVFALKTGTCVELNTLSTPDATAKTHAAFQPVCKRIPPQVKDDSWPLTDVDRFILKALEDRNLYPAPPADRRTLIRRATFDLIGLPPSPDEIAAFELDESADAFEKLVDRLLDSPHYGERWGRFWLDVARYADNKGYVFFEQKDFPWAWTYRDWVIRAFNEDLPFDRFVSTQLAADQLEQHDDRRDLAALGFLTVGAHFTNNTHDIIDDRIDVVSRGLMGLTVTCARCHDHKFDPISQADYYSLYGVFRSSIEPTVPPVLQPVHETKEYEEFEKGLKQRVEGLEKFIAEQRDLIMTGARERAPEYLLAVYHKRNHPSTENFMLLTDKGALTPAMIHRWEVYLKDARRDKNPVWSVWHAYAELTEEEFAHSARELHKRLFETSPDQNRTHPINPIIGDAFRHAPPRSIRQVAERYGELLRQIDDSWQNSVTQARESGADPPGKLADADKEQIRKVLYGKDSPAALPRRFGWGFLDLLPDRPTQEQYKKLLKEVEKWSTSAPGAPPRAMVMVDAATPYEPVVFLRGNPNRRGAPVARQMPAVVAGPDRRPFQKGSGRLELAQAIVDPANPLTARVFVNRVWQNHFGMGLVQTPSDFGLRGAPPSHPSLLDWLARRFVTTGWSVKELHRLIMRSAVYRQSSAPVGDAAAKAQQIDANNRWLWAFPRRRLDFEAMRDSLLSVSGSLNRRVGGPPVNLLEGFPTRRTVYGFVDRMDLPGLMRAFDFPDPAASSPRREQTTIAPQALFFLNHDFVSACADRLTRRPNVASLVDKTERIRRIYQIVFGRDPDSVEMDFALSFLDSAGDANSQTDFCGEDGGRWRDFAHALLMTNEFVFVD